MSEVCNFLIAEYDYDTDVAVQRDEAYRVGVEEGIEIGMEKGRVEGIQKGRMEGRVEGMQKGRMEGIQKGKIETAKNLIELGLSIEKIAKATGLTEEEIERL